MLSKQPFLPPIYIFKLRLHLEMFIYIIIYSTSMTPKPVKGHYPDYKKSLR